jgi:hypothetical protein
MKRISVSQILASANATMVRPDRDVTGAIALLLAQTLEALPADAAAVLVESEGALDLLAATSHRVADLEVYQAQVDEGPCLDAIREGVSVGAAGAARISARWPVAGPVIVQSGYTALLATPLTWQGNAFGGLNLFRSDGTSFEGQEEDCRALADAVTLILVSGRLGAEYLTEALHAALEDRAVVEQAKGALAHIRSLEMAQAYGALLALAEADGVPLGTAARRVMEQARTGTLGQRSS